ncbi:putative HAT dimerization domain, ribonuclease H-like domain, hAT-like transposase, RNase-H [Rosa chinensis]|uniref:Putative HAT dimerization domain, ribonuclease H-like domain, hAT-like transposase, RNase-H n=1 Tax=Rosa chinensis TaxID=74649 RepID=A0A2P6QQK2_ROSCH|nr:putative HAT dimerization domain, ribonuclease H-like domain, hAT-like transposase, RNase-H [Rosa chinensis]
MEELDSSIDGIRNSVKYIRSSPARLEKFRKCAAQEKVEHKGGIVPLDVCTRWNSTYFMLDLACKYKKAFMRLKDEDQQFENYFQERVGASKRQGPPRAADWEKAARLVKFLKIFYEATLKFSATKRVTANEPLLWMCTIVGELDKCIASEDPLLVSIGTSMKKKFDKYWLQLEDLNKILLIAVVLDPRYKLLYLEFFFPKLQADQGSVEVMIDEVKTTLSLLFDFYADEDPAAAAASRNVTMPRIESMHQQVDEDSHAANLHQFNLLRQEKDIVVIKNELDKYLLEASEDPSNPKFEILAWWKENAQRYPILSQIAKDVFAVPASTVASEAAFSLGKRVVDPFRASLTPKMVEGLVCLSDWLRGAGIDVYKEPTKDELQMYEELEKLEIDGGESAVSDTEE